MPAVTAAIIKGTVEFELSYTKFLEDGTNKKQACDFIINSYEHDGFKNTCNKLGISNHVQYHILKYHISHNAHLTTNIRYQNLTITTKIRVPWCFI
jgi:hypothetical protein